MNSLDVFHPVISSWFSSTFGSPTDIQAQAWPAIAKGKHVLACAPTGSGKTLMAFLYGLNKLATGSLDSGSVRILYISPLKALNADVAQNLHAPAQAIKHAFAQSGITIPSLRIMTRSGDTPPSERRRMLSKPPEILVTTPESLGILLTSQHGTQLFSKLSMVIWDEIHAVISTKRGAYLMANVDRLVAIAGDFQRIAMSATVQPRELAASVIGGFIAHPSGSMKPRPVTTLFTPLEFTHALELRITDPHSEETDLSSEDTRSIWELMATMMLPRITANRSSLIFTNTRRLCERVTRLLNETDRESQETVAFSHHGSLSKDIRHSVETRLKNGELKAIVATDSLELGIDIGELDEVFLVETPPSISKALQRIGRAGHGVGQTSRAVLYPSHGLDLLHAAALGRAVNKRDIEPIRPVLAPLDVLAQIIVSMACAQKRQLDELYDALRLSFPFHTLSRRQFYLVVDMLAGRFEHVRLAELKPRLHFDRLDNTISATSSSARLVYLSGGVIPDRGYFRLRHAATKAVIGDLDEEFVWEASLGQTFPFGAGLWRITAITAADVLAEPASRSNAPAPFYKGEQRGRDSHFSAHVANLLTEIEARHDDPDLVDDLITWCGLDQDAAAQLLSFLDTQRQATGTSLPGSTRIIIERSSLAAGGAPGGQLTLLCPWGRAQNRPLALALEEAALRQTGCQITVFAGDDILVVAGLQNPEELDLKTVLRSLNVDNLDELISARVSVTGFFGARFRECAGRALLLPRAGFNKRTPLWLTRLRAKKLLATVRELPDFPIVLEAWRECLHDAFDMEGLRTHLTDIETGSIQILETRTGAPSSFARTDDWPQINQLMYEDDTPQATAPGGGPGLDESLLAEIQSGKEPHPLLDPEIVALFTAKRKRLYPGYGPTDESDFLDHIKDRLLIPYEEFQSLMSAYEEATKEKFLSDHAQSRLCRCTFSTHDAASFVAARENLPYLLASFPLLKKEELYDLNQTRLTSPTPLQLDTTKRADIFLQWLSHIGPITNNGLHTFGMLNPSDLDHLLEILSASGRLLLNAPVGTADDVCEHIIDSESDAILLRLCRQAARNRVITKPIHCLPKLFAVRQGLLSPGTSEDDLYECLTLLSCIPLPASQLEADILPARIKNYAPGRLDSVFSQSDLIWFGEKEKTILICPEQERELAFPDTTSANDETLPPILSAFIDPNATYETSTLSQNLKTSLSHITPQIWDAVWTGHITNTGFSALRQGLAVHFAPPTIPAAQTPGGRSSSRRGRRRPPRLSEWKSHIPSGTWRRLPPPHPPRDAVDEQERCRERIRLLLDRYGILFRELVRRERPAFTWSTLFRTLRMMEFSGEVLAGLFFEEISGPQFATPDIFEQISKQTTIYWLNAADPASVCGLPFPGLRQTHPDRRPTTHLCYNGNKLVFVSKRLGKQLTFYDTPNTPGIKEYLAPLQHLLTRSVTPLSRIKVEQINEIPAQESPYLNILQQTFMTTSEPTGISIRL